MLKLILLISLISFSFNINAKKRTPNNDTKIYTLDKNSLILTADFEKVKDKIQIICDDTNSLNLIYKALETFENESGKSLKNIKVERSGSKGASQGYKTIVAADTASYQSHITLHLPNHCLVTNFHFIK